jgi:hypothetical protein
MVLEPVSRLLHADDIIERRSGHRLTAAKREHDRVGLNIDVHAMRVKSNGASGGVTTTCDQQADQHAGAATSLD